MKHFLAAAALILIPAVAFAQGVSSTPLAPQAHDMSLVGLFMQADWVVKAVMIGLIMASIYV